LNLAHSTRCGACPHIDDVQFFAMRSVLFAFHAVP
jgi:hypothetical protein